MMDRRWAVLAALVVMGALAGACGSDAQAPADDETADTVAVSDTVGESDASGEPARADQTEPVSGTWRRERTR